MTVQYHVNDRQLKSSTFLDLANRVWPGDYDIQSTSLALNRTMCITAWIEGKLVGCVRVLSDGYYFGTIPEILVDPAYQRQGIGRRLMELAWEHSPTSLFFGSQPGNEPFFEKLGFERSMVSFAKRKSRT